MVLKVLPQQSLKTRITVSTLAIFLLGLWSLSFFVSQSLRKDMERLLGEQQFATVSMVAAQVDRQFQSRLDALEDVADSSTRAMQGGSAAMQAFLAQRPLLHVLFNGDIVVYDIDGRAIANCPSSTGRVDARALDFDAVATALKEGKTAIGRPIFGIQQKNPLLGMAAPIRDAQGKVIGVLLGVIDLGIPNFLEGITEGRYGKTGGYLLIAPQYRLVVTASDKNRIMEVLPVLGTNPVIDRFLRGYEGSSVMVNPRGVEVLVSDKGIPAVGWVMAASVPTEEAFAPIRAMQQRMLIATLFLTLLIGGLTCWILRRQLSPMLAAVERLASMSDARQPLPVATQDEVGQLLGGFNRLMETLGDREATLQASDMRFRMLLQDIPSVAIQGCAPDGSIVYWNQASERLYGYSAEEAIGRDLVDLIVSPEIRDGFRDGLRQMFERGQPIPVGEFSFMRKDGLRVSTITSHVYVHVPGQAPEVFCVDVDLTEYQRMEEALRRREHYQRALLDNFPFMVWLTDDKSRFLAVNRAFATVFGWPSPESLIGKGYEDIALPHLAERCRSDDGTVLASGASKQGEEFVEIGGQRRWLETYKSPVTVDGSVIGMVGFARDISVRKQNEAALTAAVAEAEKANHAKSRFLAAASHDLRQPLSALSLYVGVLKQKVAPDTIELVGSVENCVDSLSELLTDLLDVSKLDAGVVVPRPSDFSVDEMLASLVFVHSAEAELKGLRLRSRSNGAMAHTDQTLLRRILGNLVVNAIRYTSKGGVLIACRRHQGKQWVEVWDTGIGIPDDKTEIIFEEFRQLGDSSRNRGSGLGLAIVAKTAKLLGLQIRLRSQPGRGSMFAVELPQGRALAPLRAPLQRLDARSLRIGLVEDNPGVLRALVLALENAGHEVLAATSGRELIECLAGRSPDIVISDYRLAETETGFDVIKAARDAFGDELPALLITGDTDPALVRSMADRGIAVSYKPLNIEALQAFISQATERRSS